MRVQTGSYGEKAAHSVGTSRRSSELICYLSARPPSSCDAFPNILDVF